MHENEEEPRLFVHIPIQRPSARNSVSSTEIKNQNKLRNLFDVEPKDETYPSRPRMTRRSLSNRQYSTTKTIAAAVSTQKENRKRRSRVTSTDSNSSSSSSSSSSSTSYSSSSLSEDEQKLNMSESQQQQQQQQQQKFATLPKSESNAMRKIIERRRHARSTSVPEVPAGSLHVDTFLPLHLPPSNLCVESPLLAYPSSWWPSEEGEREEAKVQTISAKSLNKRGISFSSTQSFGIPTANDELRRSESLASFISAESDGSWHGDQGDNDPDGQLARALEETQVSAEKDYVEANENEEISNNYPEISNAKELTQNGHGPLQLATYDYEEEEVHNKVLHAQVSEDSTSKGKEVVEVDEEQDIEKSAGPLMERIVKYMFNLSVFGSEHNDQSSPLENGMSHSQSDGHLYSQLSSPSSLKAETKAKQFNLFNSSSIRNRSATIAGDSDLHVHGEVDQEDLDNANGLWSLWRWIVPDIDSYMSENAIVHDKDAQAMKRNVSVPSLVSGYSLDTVDEDEWEEEQCELNDKSESTPTLSNSFNNGGLLSLSPPQLCYAESYLRDSGFGLKSFESSAFNEFNVSSEVPAKVLSTRNHLPQSIIIRTSKDSFDEQNTYSTKNSSSNPSPLWDNRLVEEPYERTWGSMLGLSVC